MIFLVSAETSQQTNGNLVQDDGGEIFVTVLLREALSSNNLPPIHTDLCQAQKRASNFGHLG